MQIVRLPTLDLACWTRWTFPSETDAKRCRVETVSGAFSGALWVFLHQTWIWACQRLIGLKAAWFYGREVP